VGDPARILSPDQHDAIWAIQKPLDFPATAYGLSRSSDRLVDMHEPAGSVNRRARIDLKSLDRREWRVASSPTLCVAPLRSAEMIKWRMPVSAYLKARLFVVAAAAALFAAAGTDGSEAIDRSGYWDCIPARKRHPGGVAARNVANHQYSTFADDRSNSRSLSQKRLFDWCLAYTPFSSKQCSN
jgi:hypothetical protein